MPRIAMRNDEGVSYMLVVYSIWDGDGQEPLRLKDILMRVLT